MNNEIDIYMDYVVAFGQTIKKPKRISVSEWERFWRRLKQR